MLIAVCCMSQIIQSTDACDQASKTQLIQYLIEKEIEIGAKKSEVDKIWDRYFYKEMIVSGHYRGANNQMQTCYKYMPIRKIYTTDADVAQYKIIEDEYILLVQDVIENIKLMVFNGADLQAYDQHGKNITSYCFTKEIYDALQHLGAPFSLQAWAYFNPNEASLAGVIAAPVAMFTTMAVTAIVVACVRRNQ